jgi:hypothetical protein
LLKREKLPGAAETVDLVGVSGHAGNDVGIAGLHRTRRPAQGATMPAGPPIGMCRASEREPQMLGQADRRVGKQREAGNREARRGRDGDRPAASSAAFRHARSTNARSPGIADIGHRDGRPRPPHRHRAAGVTRPPPFLQMAQVMVAGSSSNPAARILSARAGSSASRSAAARRQRRCSPAPCNRPAGPGTR